MIRVCLIWILLFHFLAPGWARNSMAKELKLATILFADDDALLGDLVYHKLESCGHSVTVVDNGYSVLSAALQTRPDLIILDNRMPGLRGPEVLPVLKRQSRTSAIPVLVLTSLTGKNAMAEAFRAGAADYMAKPFLPQDLADRISSLLGSQESKKQGGLRS
jgi:DNA-binding response OmpR family regulator